jgi:hypothetical protein
MGNWDVWIGRNRYDCETRSDRSLVLECLSKALDGKPCAIMRTGGYGFRCRRESDGTIRVTTSSEKYGENTARYYAETIRKALEEYV